MNNNFNWLSDKAINNLNHAAKQTRYEIDHNTASNHTKVIDKVLQSDKIGDFVVLLGCLYNLSSDHTKHLIKYEHNYVNRDSINASQEFQQAYDIMTNVLLEEEDNYDLVRYKISKMFDQLLDEAFPLNK